MNIIKYNSPFNTLMGDVLNSSISDFIGGEYVTSTPSINILEGKDKFLVEVASPGLGKSDFDIQIENDHLIISAKKEVKTEEKEDHYSRREFNYTSFKRSFYLPDTVDAEKVDAKYKEGILTISLGKKETSIDNGPRDIVIG
ncbi:MAG: Hsp20/alpha crystallin family protein [Saprospiraceae bacterium]